MSLVSEFRANGEVGRQSDHDIATCVCGGRLASLEHGEEFMKEGMAEVFLSEHYGYGASLKVFDVFVAGFPGAVEYFSVRGNFESMLQSKPIEPES